MRTPAIKLCAPTIPITAPLRYGERSANSNSSAINKHCAFRQVHFLQFIKFIFAEIFPTAL